MKKLIIPAFAFLLFSACTRDLTSLNIDPKHPVNVPSSTLFTRAQLSLSNVLTNTNVNSNVFRLVMQQWQETTYLNESYYDFGYRQIPDAWWSELYTANSDFNGFTIVGVLSSLNQARIAGPYRYQRPG